MDERNLPAEELARLLSAERLETYERHAPSWERSPLELYTLGARLASSFHHDLAIVEVVLRNALHNELSREYGTHWWAEDRLLDDRGQTAIVKAYRDARCTEDSPPGKLIAALSMGFWVQLLEAGAYAGSRPYRQRRSYDALLWRPALRYAFPYSSGVRSQVHSLVHRVYSLRNRVAHCEPVIAGVRVPGTRTRRSPAEIHEDIVTLVRWISPPIGDWLAARSHTPALLDDWPQPR
ncbi:CAAX protease [Actinopolyspora sp. H202]|uniref:CAAX protease n=1 Tax=Actinopolyspora sp. H202 TaxID=1500456 RepID=UPI003EE6D0B3